MYETRGGLDEIQLIVDFSVFFTFQNYNDNFLKIEIVQIFKFTKTVKNSNS